MKERKPLLLAELLVMLLVFSLAAALCLRGFAWANDRSEFLQHQARSAVEAQNAAELLKYTHGDYAQLGGEWVEDHWQISCEGGFIRITPEQNLPQGLAGASVEVLRADGESLTILTVRWQEVAG